VSLSPVIAGLDPAISLRDALPILSGITGTSPVMTTESQCNQSLDICNLISYIRP